jgi:hypothetical protein
VTDFSQLQATPFKPERPLHSKKLPGSRGSTEYGGVEGMIQPPPHDVNESPRDALRLVYNTDPGANVPVPIEGMDDLPLLRGYLE